MRYFSRPEALYIKKKPSFEWVKKNSDPLNEVSDYLPSATKKTPDEKNVFSFGLGEHGEKKPPLECSVANETSLSPVGGEGQRTFSPEQIETFLLNFGALNAESVSHLQRTVEEFQMPRFYHPSQDKPKNKAKTVSSQETTQDTKVVFAKFVKENLNKITAENFDVVSALLLE